MGNPGASAIATKRHPAHWHAKALAADAGRLAVPDAAMAELEQVAAYVAAYPLPVLALRSEDFALTATRRFASEVRLALRDGLGFALVDGLPMDRWSADQAIAAYWLLSSCIARPVAQNWAGRLVYEVTDSGESLGNGVRPDVTNVEQNFHTDNSYNHVPPAYVSLLCLCPARRGGISGIVSFRWALAEMRKRHPDLADRLFEPYYFDRQREHAPGDVMVTRHPMFVRDGERVVARLSRRQVINGHRLAGVPLDPRGETALETFEAILNEPGAAKTFAFAPGQIQYLDNLTIGHRRSAFEDWTEPGRKRLLIRLWLRDDGGRGYNG